MVEIHVFMSEVAEPSKSIYQNFKEALEKHPDLVNLKEEIKLVTRLPYRVQTNDAHLALENLDKEGAWEGKKKFYLEDWKERGKIELVYPT